MASGTSGDCIHSKELLKLTGEHDNPYLIKKKETQREKPKTYKLTSSSVLGEVRAFLPQIANANRIMDEELKTTPNKFDIESIENDDGPVIEMNMALVLQDGSDSSDESDSSSNHSSSDSELCLGEVTEENFRVSKTKLLNKCLIQEITSKESENCDEDTDSSEKT